MRQKSSWDLRARRKIRGIRTLKYFLSHSSDTFWHVQLLRRFSLQNLCELRCLRDLGRPEVEKALDRFEFIIFSFSHLSWIDKRSSQKPFLSFSTAKCNSMWRTRGTIRCLHSKLLTFPCFYGKRVSVWHF